MLSVGDKVRVVEHTCCFDTGEEVFISPKVASYREDRYINLARTKGGEQICCELPENLESVPEYSMSTVLNAGVDLSAYVSEEGLTMKQPDMVENPTHYSAGMPAGVEVIDVIEAQEAVGAKNNHSQAVKYLLRALVKSNTLEDYKKCVQYIGREINKLEGNTGW